MPELPEVETVRRGLLPHVVGIRITSVELRRADLRFPFPDGFAENLSGRRVRGLERRAKYLMFALDEGWVLLVHLGMSGRITVVEEGRTSGVPFHHHVEPLAGHGPHDHVLIEFEGGVRLVYTDPRRFGFMDLVKDVDLSDHPRLSHLGPEPFDESWTPEVWADSLMHRKVTIKSALLDQRALVGVGNIYACEALHRVRISPRRQARTLVSKDGRPTTRLVNLHGAVRTVLQEAIDAGGSTLRDFAAVDGSLGYFPHRFAVYDRAGESCQREGCPGTIRRITQQGRSSFACFTCQR